MAEQPTESIVLTADGQVTPAGTPGYLVSYVGLSDTGHATLNFENGVGGDDKWNDSMIATTAEGDSAMRHTFGGKGLFFDVDIYLNLQNSPKVSVEFRRA